MGLDILDLSFRLEKRFKIKIRPENLRALAEVTAERRPNMKPHDLTVGELHDWVVQICEAQGVKVPYSCWNGVRIELAKVVGKSPEIIRRDTLVVRDLGFS